MVGLDAADDAGVYRLAKDLALVQTVDFFSPIVDDPFIFGQIAAANALSDVYAMGGKPLTALAILAFPAKGAELATLRDIMAGGIDKLNESGVALIGGHSVEDDEVKFGYAVTGTIDPSSVLENKNAVPGDRVLLTKPIGTGLIATALKQGEAARVHVEEASRMMVETNGAAAAGLSGSGVRAMTDITGFGLLGHALAVARASDLTIEFDHSQIPLLGGALDYSVKGFCAGGLKENRKFFSPHVAWAESVSDAFRNLLFDPQTSGGLLVFAPDTKAKSIVSSLNEVGVVATDIGRTKKRAAALIEVH